VNIILVGYMGSGKTTIGNKLASKLGLTIVDTDKEIERLTNSSIEHIFEQKGEEYFRTLEKQLILKLNKRDNLLVSTGGGLPCFNNMMLALKELGTTIYLERTAKELAQRIVQSPKQRPIVKDKTLQELVPFIDNMLKIRNQYYQQAHIIVKRNNQNINNMEQIICHYIKEQNV